MDASRHTIAVIGCGSIGSRHIRNLHALGAGRILAVDLDADRARAAAADLPRVEVVSATAHAWEAGADVAVIALPTALHVPLAMEAAEAGCHLFIEKPLSHSIDGVEALIETCRSRGLVAAVGYNWRFNPVIARIRELLASGAVGRALAVHAHFGSYLPARHPWEDYRVGYGARADLGGGVILDAVTHQLDYLTYLFGEPTRLACTAGRRSDLEIDVEDVADLTLLLGDGVQATIHGDFVERPHRATLDVIGSAGTLRADFVAREIRWWGERAGAWVTEPVAMDPDAIYVDEMRHFLDAVEGRVPVSVDLEAATRNLVALLAARSVAATGEAVVL